MKNLLLLICFVVSHAAGSPIFKPGTTGMFGNKYQGDIKLNEAQKVFLSGGNRRNQSTRTGWTWEGFRWPADDDGHVIVPYEIDDSEGFSQSEIEIIEEELTTIEQATCIRFVKRTTEEDYVGVIDGDGCWSWLGRVGGRQEVSLDRSGCVSQGIPAHEFIHALGYDHMHNHADRDDYVKIHWENILPEMYANFDTVDPFWFDNFGTPYDLMSVMHYPRWAFSYNGDDVIEPHDVEYIDKIGSLYLSEDDALRLNLMYGCNIEE